MMKDFSVQAFSAGTIAAIVGFGSSFAVIVAGLVAVGATPVQAASGLMAAAMAMGFAGIVNAVISRQPIAAAWSTPGGALMVSTGAIAGGFEAAVGAFIIAAVLIIIAGFWRPFGRCVAMIPSPIASAMLAGVILGLCLFPMKAVAAAPEAALPVIGVWLIVFCYKRLWSVPAAVVAAVCVIFLLGGDMSGADLAPHPVLITPTFSWSAMISIAVPLFIVTMASQNIPGIAVLRSYGYEPPSGKAIGVTGVFSLLCAPFGSLSVNLSAIVAALCAGPDAHEDPAKRYWAAIAMGVVSVFLGLLASAVIALVAIAPPYLIETVAGLALLPPLAAALKASFDDEMAREAAAVTFVVAASGLSFLGIGGAFWGLVCGCGFYALKRFAGK